MEQRRKVSDIMEDIFEFPHLPYWFTLRQAVDIIKATGMAVGVSDFPRAVLIFDEKYNLLGTLDIRDILRGLDPKIREGLTDTEVPEPASLYGESSVELLDRPVSEFMRPAELFLGPDDPASLAAYFMVTQSRAYLPVLEDRRKLVGIVKMMNVFNAMTDELLAE
jgi:CBS domain-containing protein